MIQLRLSHANHAICQHPTSFATRLLQHNLERGSDKNRDGFLASEGMTPKPCKESPFLVPDQWKVSQERDLARKIMVFLLGSF